MAWQQQPNYGGFGNQGYPGAGGPFPGGPGAGPYPGGPGAGGPYPGGPGGQPPPPAGYYNPQQFGGYPNMGFHLPPDAAEQGQDYPKNDGSEYEGFEFSDVTIRRGFIRKVYSILMMQLVVTVAFIAAFVFNDNMKLWTRSNPGFFFGVLILSIVMLLAMACCESVRRKSPMNFICLGIFTCAEGFVLGAASSTYDQKSVLLAAGITAFICLSLTAFSFQTKFDMTGNGGYLFVFAIVLMLLGFLSIVLNGIFPWMHTFYACLGALLFSAYLVYDTQMMMGGKHKYSISPEEYIFAALNLYLDIVNIFIYILSIIGSRGD